jgi:hypothetical protein
VGKMMIVVTLLQFCVSLTVKQPLLS